MTFVIYIKILTVSNRPTYILEHKYQQLQIFCLIIHINPIMLTLATNSTAIERTTNRRIARLAWGYSYAFRLSKNFMSANNYYQTWDIGLLTEIKSAFDKKKLIYAKPTL